MSYFRIWSGVVYVLVIKTKRIFPDDARHETRHMRTRDSRYVIKTWKWIQIFDNHYQMFSTKSINCFKPNNKEEDIDEKDETEKIVGSSGYILNNVKIFKSFLIIYNVLNSTLWFIKMNHSNILLFIVRNNSISNRKFLTRMISNDMHSMH